MTFFTISPITTQSQGEGRGEIFKYISKFFAKQLIFLTTLKQRIIRNFYVFEMG